MCMYALFSPEMLQAGGVKWLINVSQGEKYPPRDKNGNAQVFESNTATFSSLTYVRSTCSFGESSPKGSDGKMSDKTIG